jgi:hypothetical protein
MDSRGREAGDEEAIAGTPEDVAALYSWANLQGAKYRDFSASRREYRAQVRYRAAVALRERELLAQAAAEEAAAAAERAAAIAEEAAQQDTSDGQTFRAHLLRSAEAATRRAVAERVEAARHADAAAQAAVVAQREEREGEWRRCRTRGSGLRALVCVEGVFRTRGAGVARDAAAADRTRGGCRCWRSFAGRRRGQDEPGGDAGARTLRTGGTGGADGHDRRSGLLPYYFGERELRPARCGPFAAGGKHRRADLAGEPTLAGMSDDEARQRDADR